MAKRKIIEIDRDKCDGCGLCTTVCAEGALALDEENKAVLLKEIFCDGLGVCLDVCPTGALRVIERDSETYDAEAAYKHVLQTRGEEAAGQVHGVAGHEGHGPAAHDQKSVPFSGGCSGAIAFEIPAKNDASSRRESDVPAASELSQWPIQLHLVSPYAPYFKSTDLLVAADCTAFALGSFHQDLLKGKKLIIACPKLDDTEGYIENLAKIIKQNDLNSLTVAIMTVPCCSGLYRIVETAVELSGVKIDLRKKVIHIDGNMVSPDL
jgi:NAD-dependent dihydropyrimidine dehydrogenase PreA subunit